MITAIENAMVERLKAGLGHLVLDVASYGGELDDIANVVRRLPAVWVTYGGGRMQPVDTRKLRYQNTDKFVVMVATWSMRGEQAMRQGGITKYEIGSNDLVDAVLRLMSSQTLDGLLEIAGLTPQSINPIYNNALVQGGAVSVFAIEFEGKYNRLSLESGRFPETTTDKTSPDYVFTDYEARLSEAYPDLKRVQGKIVDPVSGAAIGHQIELGDKP